MTHTRPNLDALPARLVALAIFGVMLAVYASVLPRDVLPGDSGELVVASRTLSIGHPPGYPLYLMLGRLFASVFALGSVAFRYNLFSAVAASAAAAILFLALVELRLNRLAAVLVTLVMATLPAFRLQATTAEVYSLNALFTVLLIYAGLLVRRYGQRALLLLFFVGGLALAHHLSLVYSLAGSLVIVYVGLRLAPRPRTLVVGTLLLLVGLSVLMYIPIRASLSPPLTWHNTDTLSGFASHITGQGYGWRLRPFDLMPRLWDWLRFFGILARQVGIPLTVLAALGVGARLIKRPVLAGPVCLVVFFAFHFAAYNIPDIDSHIFPAVIGMAMLAAVGLDTLMRLVRIWRPAYWMLASAVGIVLVVNLATLKPRDDEYLASDYARAVCASAHQACSDSCIIISAGDPAAFPLLYQTMVEPGRATVFDIGASNPDMIGARERPRTIEQCVEAVLESYDRSEIAILGPVPPRILDMPTTICGMVYTLGESARPCPAPDGFHLRGLDGDLPDHAARLLAATYRLHLVRWHLQQGDTAAAGQSVRRAVETASDDAGTRIEASRLHLEMGDLAGALRLARSALAVDPDLFEVHDMLGNLLMLQGRFDQAVSEFEAALKGNPNPGPLHSNLATAYASKGDHAAAIREFETALGLDSMLVNAHLGLAVSLEATGRLREAVASVRRARMLDPTSSSAYHAEAALMLKQDRPRQAVDLLWTGFAAIEPTAPMLSDMGLGYLRLDQPDSAVAYFEAALVKDPTLLMARGNLAVAFERLGRTALAIEHYRIYSETAPPGMHREMALEALRRLTSPD